MIKYYLESNPLTRKSNRLTARVMTTDTLYLKDIVKKAAKRGTSLTETDLMAAALLLSEVTSEEVARGKTVVLPLAVIRPTIRGVFNNVDDTFDESRHTKRASLKAGTMLTAKIQKARVEKLTGRSPAPVVTEFTDVTSGTTNNLITPGGIGIIIGKDLKFDPQNYSEGIWFSPTDGREPVKTSTIALQTQGKLIFSIPNSLKPGSYILEVRKKYGTTEPNIRSGQLEEQLQVT